MNKILNWTFGSLFRTIGRLFGFLIVCLLLLIIGSKLGFKLPDFLMPMYVNAEVINQWDWAENKNAFEKFQFYDCTSSSCSSVESMGTFANIETASGSVIQVSGNNSRFTIASNGVGVANWLGTLKKGYLYSYTGYYCSGSTFGNNSTNKQVFTSSSGSVLGKDGLTPTYQAHNWTTMSGIPGQQSNNSFSYCYAVTSLFVPSADSTWLSHHFTARDSSITDVRIFPIVYSLNELGIYSSSLKDIIDESGFATAESVEQVQDSVNDVKQEIQDTNDNIMNNDSSGATDEAGGFFENFNTETFGLTSIITSPLNAINSLINSSCSNLVLPLPFVDKNINLPCMTTIYSNYFGGFFQLYQIITTGLISYYIIVRIFNLVKDFKNPEHDEIEVVDL